MTVPPCVRLYHLVFVTGGGCAAAAAVAAAAAAAAAALKEYPGLEWEVLCCSRVMVLDVLARGYVA